MKTRSLTKEEFTDNQNKFNLIDMIVHEKDGFRTIIVDDDNLTEELKIFKEAVQRFENNTKISLMIE